MPISLKVVATPIGNIRDITLRAIDEITQADVILAEDTRRCKALIEALNVKVKKSLKIISCNAQNERNRVNVVIERLKNQESVLLLSDAGAPGISDPGSLLINDIVNHGFEVTVIPGPSAQIAALMGAGIDVTRFAFLGFLPQKKSMRQKLIQRASDASLALVIYESPLRVTSLLDELENLLGERRVVIARELTKLHETFHRGILGQGFDKPLVIKGECVVVVEALKKMVAPKVDDEEIEFFIKERLKAGISAKDLARECVDKFQLPKSVSYQKILNIKGN